MVPKPQARPQRVDLAVAEPLPVESIAIDVAATDAGYLYGAVSGIRSWTGLVSAPSAEVAALDAIERICTDFPERQRLRFLLNIGNGSPIWQYAEQIAAATTNWWIERPTRPFRPLAGAATAYLDHLRHTPRPLSPVDRGPLTVATDGSVREKAAGFGWLAASGAYDICGYRSTLKRLGREPVLVTELCAIGSAVLGLPRHTLLVLSDSRSAIEMVNRWKRRDFVLPVGYPDTNCATVWNLAWIQRRIFAERKRITLQWVPGHHGEPLNEGADALARLGSRYQRGDRDLDEIEYRRRAAGIAKGFAAQYQRINAA